MALTNGLLNYWKFDGDATDSVGTNDGTVNGATLTTGKINQGYDFDGVNDYIIMSNSTSFDSGDKSYSFWINPSSQTLSGFSIIWSKSASASVNEYVALSDGVVEYRFGPESAQRTDFIGSTTLTAGTWHHIVIAGSGDGSSVDNYNIYVNNNKETVTRNLIGSNRDFPTGSGDIEISRLVGTQTYYAEFIFDEFGIWNKVLTDGGVLEGQTAGGEVADLWNNGDGLQYPFSVATGIKVFGIDVVNVNGVSVSKKNGV